MSKGVTAAKNPLILFLDADLQGLTAEMISQIIKEFVGRKYEMFVAITDRKFVLVNKMMQHLLILGGTRLLKKSLWKKIPDVYKQGFQIESVLNYYVKKHGKQIGCCVLPGLTQIIKEKKRGLIKGFCQRLLMLSEITAVFLKLYIFKNEQFKNSLGEKNKNCLGQF